MPSDDSSVRDALTTDLKVSRDAPGRRRPPASGAMPLLR